jgi:hypothetical protein
LHRTSEQLTETSQKISNLDKSTSLDQLLLQIFRASSSKLKESCLAKKDNLLQFVIKIESPMQERF